MASTYTPLGVEKMATGENAGTWGTKTNTNLDILEQISGGYAVQTLNAGGSGANETTLSVSDGSTGATLATRVIILGAESPQAITGAKIVTVPNDDCPFTTNLFPFFIAYIILSSSLFFVQETSSLSTE